MGNFDFNGAIGSNLGDPKYDKDAVNLRTLKTLASQTASNGFIVSKISLTGSTGTTISQLNIVNSFTPSGSTDGAGFTGDITWDDTAFYFKTTTQWLKIVGAPF